MTKDRKIKEHKKGRQPKDKMPIIQINGKPIVAKERKKTNKITPAGQMLRRVGGIAGGFLGSAKLGSELGAGISRIFGQGDYTVKNNSLMQGGPPAFASLNSGMRLAHREYITDVMSSTAFANKTYYISPTNAALFPWLSKIASNFEEYSFKGLVFYFNTTCGNAISSTNNSLGVVGMTTVYDPTDPDLATKRECEDYVGCVANVPSCSLLHPVECKKTSNVLGRYYVQTVNLTSLEDLKFYVAGKLNLFTQGMQAAGVSIGELWVSYDIELYDPKILPIGTVGAASSFFEATITDANGGAMLGATPITSSTGNLGMTYTGTTAGYFTISQGTASGYYLFQMSGSTPGSTFNTVVSNLSSNLIVKNIFQGNSTGVISLPNASASVPWHGVTIILYKSDSNFAQFQPNLSTGSFAAGTVQMDVILTKLYSGIDPAATSFLSSERERKEQKQAQLLRDLIALGVMLKHNTEFGEEVLDRSISEEIIEIPVLSTPVTRSLTKKIQYQTERSGLY
jgi:hypothetical protein